MAQTLQLEIKGLHTYSSELSGIPKGALSVAKNIDITRLNIAGPRRGYNFLDQNLPTGTDRISRFAFYDAEILAHYNNTTFALYNSGSGWLSRGSLVKPTTASSTKSAKSNKNLYLTSSTGLKKMDDTAESIFQAGLPQGLYIEGSLSGAGTAVANNDSVGYRYVIGIKDRNNNLQLGGVSSRFTISNSAGSTQDVDLTVYIPDGLSTSHFVQIYRSVGTTGTPSDNMQIAYEHNLSSGDITAGSFTITDITPDALLGAYLYTSPEQEGIANNNFEPPLANDIEEYKGHLFFADTTSKYRFTFSLIGTGSPDGLQLDDTITIDDGTNTEVYTAKAATTVANKEFALSTGGTPEQNIEDTSRAMVKVINDASDYWYAYLLSTGESGTLPGRIMIEARTLGADQFDLTSDRSTAFSPQLESTATDSQKSSNDSFKNGLMFSKNGQPEAVPLKNIFFVGSSDDRIKRILALRDGLFIFKTDGVYVLRGVDENSFSIQPLDLTAKIIAADSMVIVNNMIYGLFDSGVCASSDSGVQVVSLPIKEQFEELIGSALTELEDYGFGVSDQVNGKYILALVSESGETYNTQQFVYDTNSQTWAKWDLAVTVGGVNPEDNKIHFGDGLSSKILIERRAFDFTDYADFGSDDRTISAFSGTTVTIDGTSEMTAGDYLQQDELTAYIESVDQTAGTVVIDIERDWTLSTADVTHLKGIDCEIEWNPDFAGSPSGLKMFYEAIILFKQLFQKEATFSFFSDLDPSINAIEVDAPDGNGAWGEFDWGEIPWGGEGGKDPIRIGIPRTKSRCGQLSVRFACRVVYSDFLINGVSLTYNPVSTRIAR